MKKIELVSYDSKWNSEFKNESGKIINILGSNCVSINHIGSTAIPDIYSKPVVDILLAVNNLNEVDKSDSDFEKLGYICRGEYGCPGRRYFKKISEKQSFHIHAFQENNPEIKRHLAFRDYLINHPAEARAYSWIKRCLSEQFPLNMDEYTTGKDSFIRMINYRSGVIKEDQLHAQDDIVVLPHDPNWLRLARAEINAITNIVSLPFVAIEHLGSTSVQGLHAKPIIDIFISLDSFDHVFQWIKQLEAMGYEYLKENPGKTHLKFFKGRPPHGIGRTHHVHILTAGEEFDRHVLFRDILRNCPEIMYEYESLKIDLAQRYRHDREGYMEAKANFITMVLKR